MRWKRGLGLYLWLLSYAVCCEVWDVVFGGGGRGVLGVVMKVHGELSIGKHGNEFSGAQMLRVAVCWANFGHLVLFELVWLDKVPHEMQW